MKRTIIGAGIVAALALAGCGASDKTDGPKGTVPGAVTTTTAGDSTPGTEPAAEETTTTTEAPKATEGSKESPLKVGPDAALIGEWEVAITEIIPNATDQVVAENEFNEPPEKGQYMLVRGRATYRGDSEGMPDMALTVTLSGGDAVQYPDHDCWASVGSSDYPTLEPGGAADFAVCLDVPAAAVQGGTLFVEDQMSFTEDGTRAYWALP